MVSLCTIFETDVLVDDLPDRESLVTPLADNEGFSRRRCAAMHLRIWMPSPNSTNPDFQGEVDDIDSKHRRGLEDRDPLHLTLTYARLDRLWRNLSWPSRSQYVFPVGLQSESIFCFELSLFGIKQFSRSGVSGRDPWRESRCTLKNSGWKARQHAVEIAFKSP
ncbi:hypothetical protein KC330_g25 [Hortaea werneckii]|nr:hypothetical protein KC330_g25 [Hortaea werneckii]